MTIRVISRKYPRKIVENIVSTHMRLSADDDELYVDAIRLVCSAFDIAENYTSRIIVGSKIEVAMDKVEAIINIATAPVSHVESISYIAVDGTQKLLGFDCYNLVSSEHYTRIEFFEPPKCTNVRRLEKIFIKCDAGYDDYDDSLVERLEATPILPGAIVAAVQLIAGTLSMVEGDIVIGRLVSDIPMSAKSLLNPYRLLPYGA